MIFFTILVRHVIIPFGFGFCFGGFSVLDTLSLKKNKPPARLFAIGSERYDASLKIHRTMSLALYQIVAFGFAAQ